LVKSRLRSNKRNFKTRILLLASLAGLYCTAKMTCHISEQRAEIDHYTDCC